MPVLVTEAVNFAVGSESVAETVSWLRELVYWARVMASVSDDAPVTVTVTTMPQQKPCGRQK